MLNLIYKHQPNSALIFSNTKRMVDDLFEYLNDKDLKVGRLHGDMSQAERTRVLNNFKENKINILIASDVAARGIDVDNISHVINYEMPQEDELYIHRIGRTGRANKKGDAYSIVTNKEKAYLMSLERKTNSKITKLEVPTNEEIFEQKIRELLFDIQEDMLKGNKDPFVDIVRDIPANMKTDVMATMLSMLYSQRVGFDYKEEVSDKKYDRIFMNCGSMDKVGAIDIIEFLSEVGHVKRGDIGDITIKRKFTFVDVKSKVSQKVMKNCHKQKINGRRVKLEILA